MKNSLLRHSMDGLPDCETDKVEQSQDLDGIRFGRIVVEKARDGLLQHPTR